MELNKSNATEGRKCPECKGRGQRDVLATKEAFCFACHGTGLAPSISGAKENTLAERPVSSGVDNVVQVPTGETKVKELGLSPLSPVPANELPSSPSLCEAGGEGKTLDEIYKEAWAQQSKIIGGLRGAKDAHQFGLEAVVKASGFIYQNQIAEQQLALAESNKELGLSRLSLTASQSEVKRLSETGVKGQAYVESLIRRNVEQQEKNRFPNDKETVEITSNSYCTILGDWHVAKYREGIAKCQVEEKDTELSILRRELEAAKHQAEVYRLETHRWGDAAKLDKIRENKLNQNKSALIELINECLIPTLELFHENTSIKMLLESHLTIKKIINSAKTIVNNNK